MFEHVMPNDHLFVVGISENWWNGGNYWDIITPEYKLYTPEGLAANNAALYIRGQRFKKGQNH